MKRFITYLIAIALFPQVISAVILVSKPQKTFSISQTYVITHNPHKCISCLAPNIWAAYNAHDHNGDWKVENVQHHNEQNKPEMLSKNFCQQKSATGMRQLFGGRIVPNSQQRLAQAQ